MKRKMWLWLFLPLILVVYLTYPVLLQLFYKTGYDKDELKHIVIVGHRGGASIGAENTLACYRKGIEAGADMIEIDIHLTKDRKIVVCHDQTLDRTTNGKGKIREKTFGEIRQYRVMDSSSQLTDQQVPSIDEVFELFQEVRSKGNHCRLLIEIKRTNNIYQGIEELLLQTINHYQAKEWVVVQSFDDSALETIHHLDPSICVEKLLFCKLPGLPFIIDGFHISSFSYEKYDYIHSFNMNYRWLTKSFLNDIRNHGKQVKIWTLEGTEVPHLDVNGVITNRPDLWSSLKKNAL